MLEHTPLTTNSFNGLYKRSDETKVPFDHLADCLNLRFKDGQFETREGSEISITFSSIILRMRIYKKSNEAPRYLILNASGQLFDATVNTITPILTVSGMTDFSTAVVNDRCYITPHNGLVGLPNQFVYVYDGTGNARKAAGSPAVGSPGVTDGAAGKVEAGIHLIGVAFETISGFISTFGTPTLHDCPGEKKLDLTGIPTGPAGTIARHIVATKAEPEYNGDPNSVEFFFVPKGNIGENTSTTLTIDFYDSELIASCDYLLEQLKEIPAGVNLVPYNGRLCVVGTNLHPDAVLVSKKNEPESFNEIEGFFEKKDSQVNFRNGFEYRGIGYFGKSDRWYAVKDTDDEAITWDVMDVDMAVGCECHTVASVLDKEGKNIFDGVFVADRTGLYFFNGGFSEKALSWKMDAEWNTINKAIFHKVDICVDPILKCGYIVAPMGAGSTDPNAILYFDFSKAITHTDVRWCRWEVDGTGYITSAVVEVNHSTRESIMKFSAANGHIRSMSNNVRLDVGQTIRNYARFAYVGTGESGSINHFHGIRLRANGNGQVLINATSLNSVSYINPPPITLSLYEEGFKDRVFNLVTERASVQISMLQANHWMKVTEFTLLSKIAWEMRPNP